MKQKLSFLLPVCMMFWMTARTQTTWTGNVSTNWNHAGNWTAGIPDPTDDVTIPNKVNDPVIPGGTAAVAKSVTVLANGVLTLNATGSLTINGATTNGLDNLGTVNNSGLIRIGNTAAVGNIGLQNQAIFNNLAGGEISIDQSPSIGLFNATGTFTNASKINIGAIINGGNLGMQNNATFNNNAGSEINIDRTLDDGIYNYFESTFNNAAKINIGTAGNIGFNGILNDGAFNNNNGGEIKIERCTYTCVYNYFNGTFINVAKITIGSGATAGNHGIGNGNIFQNNAGGEIRIDSTLDGGLRNHGGTFTNAAKIYIGTATGIGSFCIENYAIFNNQTGGEMYLERAVGNALSNLQNTFNNAAKISIGATAGGGAFGIDNQATFNNNAGGEIIIDRTVAHGLNNQNGSTFINAAKITIGSLANLGANGILNNGTFNNNFGGDIRIDRTTYVGLYNYFNGLFNNTAKITIGAAAANAGEKGITNASVFNNTADGDIKIDRTTVRGLNNRGTFLNAARITIGATLAGTGEYALANSTAVFTNQSCAFLIVFGTVYNTDAFTNNGLFYVNTPGAHSNTGLTNNGILTYPMGNPIPNVTNNDLVIAPISGTGVIPNALQKGIALSFTAAPAWFLDAQQTIPGGTYNQAANTFTPVGGTGLRYFNITDNVNGCIRQVIINNGLPPTITCPANIVKSTDPNQCSAVVTYATPTASCNCSPAPTVTHVSGGTSGSVFPKGATTVTWMAADASSNTATCSFTITVNDTQAPAITCPANQTKNTDPNFCTAVVTYAAPTYTDNCAGVNAVLQSGPASGAAFPKGQTTVTWRATDAAGGTKTCTFRVTVNDMQAPGIACPVSQTIDTAPGQCSAVAVYATPTADDNCTPQPTVIKVSGLSSGSTFPKGLQLIVWKATDGTGNTKTCSFSITVKDNQLPVVLCPANIVVTAPAGTCSATVAYNTPLATDNCALQSSYLLTGLASYSVFPQGVTTNVWKATDDSGFTATCAFTVTVNCGTSPETMNDERGIRNGQQETEQQTASSFTIHRLSFNLVPNPATTEVVVSMEGLDENGGELTVFDAAGRLMWQQFLDQMAPQRLDVSTFQPGLYRVSLRTADSVATKTLVVNRL